MISNNVSFRNAVRARVTSAFLIRILDLQKDRFFELLNAKYWNASKMSMCPNADDSEGITLESLGKIG